MTDAYERPRSEAYQGDGAVALPWSQARERLARADGYWLATVRPTGLPHLVPVLGVWVDEALYFAASPASRKARNVAHDQHCVVAARQEDLDLVIEGTAEAGSPPQHGGAAAPVLSGTGLVGGAPG